MAYRATEHTLAKKAGTRERILKEARALVAQGGFAAAAVAQVASRSDIATGTIYRHFPSKAELVAEVFRHATERELSAVTTATQEGESCRQRLLNAVDTFADRALRAPRLAYALIAEPVDPLVEKERLSYRFAYAEAFEDLINEGVSKEEFVPQNASISAAALVGMLSEALVGPLAPQVESTGEQLVHPTSLSDTEKATLIEQIKALALRSVAGTV
ncbi:MAG: TetR/AcrR family transcriptional regulator [Gammaproteobacteria bacterium]|nr:TetR/AcrR family transcriptional regulator [Gammaproteobacteria bacterium]